MAENNKAGNPSKKEKEEESDKVSQPSLFQPDEKRWQLVGGGRPHRDGNYGERGRARGVSGRRGRGQHRGSGRQALSPPGAPANRSHGQNYEGASHCGTPSRGRPGKGQGRINSEPFNRVCGRGLSSSAPRRGYPGQRGFDSGRGKPRGRGGPGDNSSVERQQQSVKESQGFVQDVLYEKNKLYVLGLRYKTTKDSVQNYIERISGEDVRHVLMFKPNGKAIVTLKAEKIRDFAKICKEAEKRKLDGVNVVLERAPVCKSVFVCGLSEKTTKEQVEKYFDDIGVVERVEFNGRNAGDKRAIIYFQTNKSVEKVVREDNRLDDTALHVERFYPFLGTVEPVDQRTRAPRPLSREHEEADRDYFYKEVNSDIMGFIIDQSNQGLNLKEELFSSERAKINWTNKDGYMLVKYNGPRLGDELEEWKIRCSSIIDNFVEHFEARELSVSEAIWERVNDELRQIEAMYPKFTAQVKKDGEAKTLLLVCHKSQLLEFERKLKGRLQRIEREELEKTFEQKIITDIPSKKLQLLQNAGIEKLLKRDVDSNVKTKIDLKTRNLFVMTPRGSLASANALIRAKLNEIDKHATQNPPEILDILKTKVGKRKLNEEFKEAEIECAFNVDEKNKKILFLGTTSSDTDRGKRFAEKVLVNEKLPLQDRDNDLLQSSEWSELGNKLVKRLKIRYKRELTSISVFGFKKDVEETLRKMRDFRNLKQATEGEFRWESNVCRRLYNEFYKGQIQEIEEVLSDYSVKVTFLSNGDLRFTGSEEGVKEVEEWLYALQDEIKEIDVSMTVPGMRKYLAQEGGDDLIKATEQQHKCVIELAEVPHTQLEFEDSESDSKDSSNEDSDEEELDCEDQQVLLTPAGKKLIWKTGNIAEEKADVLVCSVGSRLNLSVGAIARAMREAGGAALEEELNAKKERNLKEGETIYTGPGNLSCNYVIYGVCCPWNDDKADSEMILRELLLGCFGTASKLGQQSIGLPLIGTGNLYFPYHEAVRIAVDTALDYSNKTPQSSIEEFRFIVFNGRDSEGAVSAIDEKFRKERCKRTPPIRNFKCGERKMPAATKEMFPLPESALKEVSVGDLKVRVIRGDITKESSDGMCSVIGQDMKSGSGSEVIANACGISVQVELGRSAEHHDESAIIATSGKLPCKNMPHMVVQNAEKPNLQIYVKDALTQADSQGMASVSISADHSKALGQTPEEITEVIFDAIQAFAEGPHNSVHEVRIIVSEDSIIQAFLKFPFCNKEIQDQNMNFGNSEQYQQRPLERPGKMFSTQPRQHKLTVYGREETLDAAIIALQEGVAKKIKTFQVKKTIIARLPRRSLRDLKRKAREGDVLMDHSEEDTIKLRGLPDDVLHLYSELSSLIQGQMTEKLKEERAEMTSKNVQWSFTTASGRMEPFKKIVNDDIETAYQSKQPSVSFVHKGFDAELNFETMKLRILKTNALIHASRNPVIPLPNHWDPQPLDELKGQEETVHLVSLHEESSEFQEVKKQFLETAGSPAKFSILSIQRVQNPSMYRSYVVRKQSMDEKNRSYRNERKLFHGTKYDSVKGINAQGFNRSFCGQQGAAFGDGVYFATTSQYSSTFSQAGPKGDRCMFLASVLVGKYTEGEEGLRAPPPKDPTNREHLYDSVVDSKDNPTIFVVFYDYQCYPDYLLTFK